MTAALVDSELDALLDWAPGCQMATGGSDEKLDWTCGNDAEYYADVHCWPCWRPKLICKRCLDNIILYARKCRKCGPLTCSSQRIKNVTAL